MKQHQLPLLIFAQSARLLAQSASQAGYTVWLADCFLDTDTPAQRKLKLPPLSSLDATELSEALTNLTQNQPCLLIYGSGIEYCPSLLNALPDTITLIGNNTDTLHLFNSPKHFFKLLTDLKLPFPQTSLTAPQRNQQEWLIKPNHSLGGQNISTFDEKEVSDACYFQTKINGISGSILFVTNQNDTRILSINEQLAEQNNFVLAGIEAPLKISDANLTRLTTAVSQLIQATQLKGINSLDFIIDDNDDLFILEVNPRPSASMALVDKEIDLINLHLAGCSNETLPDISIHQQRQAYRGFYYLFSPQQLTIKAGIEWPSYCSDIPPVDTIIEQGQPICSFFAYANNAEQCQKIRLTRQHYLLTLFN